MTKFAVIEVENIMSAQAKTLSIINCFKRGENPKGYVDFCLDVDTAISYWQSLCLEPTKDVKGFRKYLLDKQSLGNVNLISRGKQAKDGKVVVLFGRELD